MSLFQGHFASVSKFSQTAPEESSQNKCNQVELPKGGDIQNTTVCIDLMGVKVSKWNKPGGDSAYERGGDTRRKFGIKPLKETDLGVAQAFFDP